MINAFQVDMGASIRGWTNTPFTTRQPIIQKYRRILHRATTPISFTIQHSPSHPSLSPDPLARLRTTGQPKTWRFILGNCHGNGIKGLIVSAKQISRWRSAFYMRIFINDLCMPNTPITRYNPRPSDQSTTLKWYHFSHRRFSLFSTDANIDESCNRTLHGPNWVVCVGISISILYNRLLTMTNTRITPWVTVQGKGLGRTAPRFWFPTLLNKFYACVTRPLPLLPTVVRYQR